MGTPRSAGGADPRSTRSCPDGPRCPQPACTRPYCPLPAALSVFMCMFKGCHALLTFNALLSATPSPHVLPPSFQLFVNLVLLIRVFVSNVVLASYLYWPANCPRPPDGNVLARLLLQSLTAEIISGSFSLSFHCIVMTVNRVIPFFFPFFSFPFPFFVPSAQCEVFRVVETAGFSEDETSFLFFIPPYLFVPPYYYL